MKKRILLNQVLIQRDAIHYFKKTLTHNKKVNIWILRLDEETEKTLNVFDLKPPTYKEITSTINKLKSSRSACLCDQMSIIILKKSPILRTFIHKILHCWREQKIPSCWKHAFTILIHIKGSNTETSTSFCKNAFIAYSKYNLQLSSQEPIYWIKNTERSLESNIRDNKTNRTVNPHHQTH